jgi:hypothetical protein
MRSARHQTRSRRPRRLPEGFPNPAAI